MRLFSALASMLICLAACHSNSNPDSPAATVATPPEAARPVPPKAEPDSAEHLEVSTVMVSGLPAEQLTTQELTCQLGRPDSIAKGAVECGSRLAAPVNRPDGDFWYYGKTRYEVSGSQAILCSLDVTAGKFQGKIGTLALNKNTTLEDVRRFFPNAAKDADQPAGPGRPAEVISLPFYDKGVPMDGALNLLFQNGRLRAVEFFSPC